MKPVLVGVAIGAALMLAGCGEKDQSLPATVKKTSAPPWKGAQDPFVARGWTPGDKDSWEAEIRSRNQKQNEYVLIGR